MKKIYIIVFIFQLCSSCLNNEHPIENIKFDVAGYSITLGTDLNDIKKGWPLVEQRTSDYNDDIELFQETYEEHTFLFCFYKGRLIECEFVIPPSEVTNNCIKMNNQVIINSKTIVTKTVRKDSNYSFEIEPFNWDGIKGMKIVIEFTGAKKLIDENKK